MGKKRRKKKKKKNGERDSPVLSPKRRENTITGFYNVWKTKRRMSWGKEIAVAKGGLSFCLFPYFQSEKKMSVGMMVRDERTFDMGQKERVASSSTLENRKAQERRIRAPTIVRWKKRRSNDLDRTEKKKMKKKDKTDSKSGKEEGYPGQPRQQPPDFNQPVLIPNCEKKKKKSTTCRKEEGKGEKQRVKKRRRQTSPV